MKSKINIWNRSGCLSREAILAFAGKTLSPADRFPVEKHLEECPLCKEALEGFSTLTPDSIKHNYHALDDAFSKKWKAERKPASGMIWIGLAAAIVLALIGIFTLVKNIPSSKNIPIAQEIKEKANVPPLRDSSFKEELAQESPPPPRQNDEVHKPVQDKKYKELSEVEEAPTPVQPANEDIVADKPVKEVEEQSAPPQPDRVIGYALQSSSKAKRSEPVAGQTLRYSEKAVVMEKKENSETTYYMVEQPAKFEGGDIDKFRDYLKSQLKLSVENKKISTGALIINFTIDSRGAAKDIFIVKGLDAKTDSTVTSLIKDAPKWQPAKQDGKPVNVNMALPLEIKAP